jgi:GcrA cell cycle regulator
MTEYSHASNSDWNDDRARRLETLYDKGLSFRSIAKEIGVSRSAAIGKAYRMNLPKRLEVVTVVGNTVNTIHAPKKPKKRRTRWGIRPAEPPKPPTPEPAVVIVPGVDYRCTILELSDNSCRWPLWQFDTPHAGRLYCGAPGASVSGGVPYCRLHAKRAPRQI